MKARTWIRGASVLAVASGVLGSPAYAQDTAPAPSSAQASAPAEASGGETGSTATKAGEDIVVTGSRVSRTGFTAPTPTTVVGAADLARTGATNVANLLNQLPAFRATVTASTGTLFRDAGSNYLDLRGLGIVRTLTLVNGQRHVPSNITGQVDINLIPSILVERTEVVTGGASAAYGSDAVAGVVNIILKKNFEGLDGEAQYGVSSRGDNRELNLGLLYGTSFFDDRVHFTLGAQYVDNDGVGGLPTRPWGRNEVLLFSNPGFPANGLPSRLLASNVHPSTSVEGGLINSPGVLKGIQFLAGGQPAPFTYGTLIGPTFMIGGSGRNIGDYQRIAVPLERTAVNAGLSFEITPDIEATANFSWGQSKVSSFGGTIFDTNLTILRDNPYIPASIRTSMDANGVTQFSLGRVNRDLSNDRDHPFIFIHNHTDVYRGTLGLSGKLGGGWSWSAYYEHGQVDRVEMQDNQRITANFFRAIDAVVNPANGAIVCRSTVSVDPAVRTAAAGCVPYNVFGPYSRSDEAARYVTGRLISDLSFTQDVAAATVQGEPFSTWAGPVSVAVGGEYRNDRARTDSDPISKASGFFSGNPKPISGRVEVKEVFGETVVPLAKDVPFARLFEFNGAVRYTDYSTSGGVTSWKAGLNYKPTEDVRVRFTRSRDIRAPNINELFTTSTSLVSLLTDPQNNAQNNVLINSGGNRNLKPEFADTITAGIVLEPSGIPGFRVSIDGYDIRIKGIITTLSGQDIINRCFAGATNLCPLLVRNSAGVLTSVSNQFQNLASLKTRGIDFEVLYRLPLRQLAGGLNGSVTARGLVTYVDKLATNDGQTTVDVAGETGGVRAGGVPKWSATGVITYDNGPLMLSTQVRYVGSGKYDALGTPQNVSDNSVPSRTYVQLAGSYRLFEGTSGKRKLELFGVVDNLFDVDPPLAPNQNSSYTNAALFDMIGRTFKVGARFHY